MKYSQPHETHLEGVGFGRGLNEPCIWGIKLSYIDKGNVQN